MGCRVPYIRSKAPEACSKNSEQMIRPMVIIFEAFCLAKWNDFLNFFFAPRGFCALSGFSHFHLKFSGPIVVPRAVVRSAGRLVVRNGEKLKLPRFVTMFHLSVMAGAFSIEFFCSWCNWDKSDKKFPIRWKDQSWLMRVFYGQLMSLASCQLHYLPVSDAIPLEHCALW